VSAVRLVHGIGDSQANSHRLVSVCHSPLIDIGGDHLSEFLAQASNFFGLP